MLDIVYKVDEGARYRVGRINIEIKARTRTHRSSPC